MGRWVDGTHRCRLRDRSHGTSKACVSRGRKTWVCPFEPEVAVAQQREVFAALGCHIEDAEPDFSDADEALKTWRAWSFELALGALLPAHRARLKDTVVWNIEAEQRLTGPELARAEVKRTQLFQRVSDFMTRYEFLILPVCQMLPFAVEQPYIERIAGVPMATYIDWMKSCYYISAVGNRALSMPCAFSAEGLPIGLQIVGRHQDDWGVLQLGHAFEQTTGVGGRRPALAMC